MDILRVVFSYSSELVVLISGGESSHNGFVEPLMQDLWAGVIKQIRQEILFFRHKLLFLRCFFFII